jgi:hypothetical protein
MDVVDNAAITEIPSAEESIWGDGDSPATYGKCFVTGEECPIRQIGSVAVPWPFDLYLGRGSPYRLGGITLIHDFQWDAEIGHNRREFRNGKRLASLVKKECPEGRQPVLLLTVREDVRQGTIALDHHWILVVNIRAYLAIPCPDAAKAFFTSRIRAPITRCADLTLPDVESWARSNPEQVPELQSVLDSIASPAETATGVVLPQDVLNALRKCQSLDADSVCQVLDLLYEKGGTASALLCKAIDLCQLDGIDERVAGLDSDTIQKVNGVLGIAACRKLLSVWESNQQKDDEGFWHGELARHSFVISHIFASPVVVVGSKVYVGGKGLNNAGGTIADFLCKNAITDNAALVEIKTPLTPLLNAYTYRDGVYAPCSKLVGATVQVLDQKDSLTKEWYTLNEHSNFNLEVFSPKCVVVAGHSETLENADRLKSFELYRRNLTGVEIITFDELFERIARLIQVLEAGDFQPI